jgi:hypothetical protein
MIKPKNAVPPSLILPRVELSWDTFYSARLQVLRMTEGQADLAVRIAAELDLDGASVRICHAWDRAYRAWRELEEAMNIERRELLLSMARRCPAAARRLMKATPIPPIKYRFEEAQVVPFKKEN